MKVGLFSFTVYSIMLFALGIKAQDNLRQFKTILQGINPPILPTIIFTGFIGIIGSITGYCKIMKPNQIHITCMTIATITELCISLGTVMTPNEFITNANYTLKDSLNYYDIHPLYHEQFEQLQTDYKCCGSSMFTDYRRTNNSLPASCKNNETIYTMVSQFIKLYKFVSFKYNLNLYNHNKVNRLNTFHTCVKIIIPSEFKLHQIAQASGNQDSVAKWII
ncbi:unnamed protein product [Schistosoma mattheei]|uniref:Uncharacterized protein n=1 Tax=Schistosoma mattheei TaxID=31246 RepID=A0A183NYR4_9TREM|nr:unnamed protein product [Schistosoma mattheei]